MKKLAQAALLTLALAALPAASFAQPACGGTIAGDGTVVLGEVRGTGYLGICVRDPAGVVTLFPVPTCNMGTPIGQVIRFSSSGVYTGVTTIAPAVIPVDCAGTWVDPFPLAFNFGLWFTGYAGRDIAYGTPNRDYLHGNTYVAFAPDGAIDTLCGYEDDDVLVGDMEAVPPALHACLEGGVGGADQCHNGRKATCEAVTGYGMPVLGCGCGMAPPNIW